MVLTQIANFLNISWQTLVIFIAIIIILLIIRYYANKINHICYDFDEMRRQDLIHINRGMMYDNKGDVKMYKPIKLPKEIKPKKPKKINKGEEACRQVFERIFNRPFVRIRPDFLKNDCTDLNMEIDGYNEDLKLGFEYQGVQHYKYTPYFHKDINDFNKQIYRDNLKRELLEKDGVKIIYVPYSVEHEKMEDYVKDELKRMNFSF